jgi:hypothetical protein
MNTVMLLFHSLLLKKKRKIVDATWNPSNQYKKGKKMTAIRKAPKGAKPSSRATTATTATPTVIAEIAEKLILEIQVLLNDAYLSGFKASSEGYNAEVMWKHTNNCLTTAQNVEPDDDADWCINRGEAVTKILRGEVA